MIWYYQFSMEVSCARTVKGKVCILYKSLMKYIPKFINLVSNINNITWGCKTCISEILLQSYLNKWWLSQLAKLDKLYINSASTRLLQRSKNYFIEYKNRIFSNNSHIHLRSCDSASSYHCPYPITVPKIPEWGFIINCCSDCSRINGPYLEPLEQLDFLFPASLHKIKFHMFQKYINAWYTN